MPTRKVARRTWTEQDTEYLKGNYKRVPVSTLAEQLDRSQKATRNQLERMGISLSALKRNEPKPKIIRRKYEGWHYANGRRYVSVKDRGSLAEHRYLVEQKLGRRLERTEHVHHIDCDKKNNNIKNLHLFANAATHMACHRSLEEVTAELMARGIVRFNTNKGRYEVCKTQQ